MALFENTPDLFDFCAGVHHDIIEKHKTINKAVRRVALWDAVLGNDTDNTMINKKAGL